MFWVFNKTNNSPQFFIFFFFYALCALFTLFSTLPVVTCDILPGSTLYASNPNQKWSSQDNSFSLLFLPITSSTFSLCIAYSGSIPIWCPAKEVDIKASFHFLPNGNLLLNNGSGAVIWQSNTTHLGISSATLDNSGNFILKNGSVSLWHSFEHLVDTIVPSQNFTVGSVLTSGYYSFSIDKKGVLTLKWNNSIMYWSFGLNSSVTSNFTKPSLSLQGIGILSLYGSSLSKPLNLAYSSDFGEGDDFRFLKLDNDGNLRIYSAAKGSGVANVKWTAVGDQCDVFGYCGNMGICSYDENDNPICFCPSENFDPVDSNDARKGCNRKVEIKDCPGNETLLEMNHTMFLTYPPETSTDVYIIGISACRSNCLSGSSCVASSVTAHDTGQCYIKTSNFVSGHMSPTIPGSSFVKVCSPIEPNPPPPMENSRNCDGCKLHVWLVVFPATLGMLIVLIVVGGFFWWSRYRNNPNFVDVSAQYTLLDYASGAPVQFSYKVLHKATKGFKEKLGAGGFGAVYKGTLSNEAAVAVKQLEGIEQGEKQFRMEVATISSTHHLNLVRLIGFCSEGRRRLLVYDFMKNGSLDMFLFGGIEDAKRLLKWEQRFNIALGTARGITYLHEECRDCILHCDIKPENILLNENFEAKVSDFGLAKLISLKDQKYQTLTSVRGTRGYLAPEWLSNLPITSKSDVYSFGMVLLEIVSGRRNFETSLETNGKKFSSWAYEEFEIGNVVNLVDNRLGEMHDIEQVMRAVQVSFWCIREQPSHRPTMGKVVQMLEGIVPIENPPPLKASGEDLGVDIFCASTSTTVPSTIATSNQDPSWSSLNRKSLVSGVDLERPSSSLIQARRDWNEDL